MPVEFLGIAATNDGSETTVRSGGSFDKDYTRGYDLLGDATEAGRPLSPDWWYYWPVIGEPAAA